MLQITNDKQFWIDTSNLKGNEFTPVEEVERITSISRNDAAYSLMMRNIIGSANIALEESPLTVCQYKYGIKVLDNPASAVYHQYNVRYCILKMIRSNRKLTKIDLSKLETEHRKQHERNLLNNSRVLQAMKKADREQLN